MPVGAGGMSLVALRNWVSYSKVIGLPDFLEFSIGGGFSGQDWFQWVRDLSFHRRRVN